MTPDVARESALSAKGLPDRLRDWWDFLATRMNHPKDSSSELRAERPALLDDLREAASEIERLRGPHYVCRADGYHPGNTATWCELGCGSDYNRMHKVEL